MPLKKITLGRWEILAAFLFNIIAVIIVAILLGQQIHRNHRLAKEGVQAHNALCVLRENLEQQIQSSQDFLRKHSNGIDGVSATDINLSIKRLKQTVKSLDDLRCQ